MPNPALTLFAQYYI